MMIRFKDLINIFEKAIWKRHVCTIGGIKVFVVDGMYVRNNIYVDYVEGGHGYVYPKFIPKNEVWIEELVNQRDMSFNLGHELFERNLMKNKGMNYNDAHDRAKDFERRMRNKYKIRG